MGGEKERVGGGFAWHTEVFGLKTKFKDQMSKQAKGVDPYRLKDLATSIRLATEDKEKQAIQKREVQENLRAHMGKRHRGE